MWFSSRGLHSSRVVTVRFRSGPYVCWSYYEPSGNQWAETHLGAHLLVISLISLLARAIWTLSAGQWPSGPGWLIWLFLQIADQWLWVGPWIFPSLPPLCLACAARAWCMWCFHEVQRMTDTSRRGGRLTGWLGDRHPQRALTHTVGTQIHRLHLLTSELLFRVSAQRQIKYSDILWDSKLNTALLIFFFYFTWNLTPSGRQV